MKQKLFRVMLFFVIGMLLMQPVLPSVSAQVVSAALPDVGDAPDASNNTGASMLAYPGVTAAFPTAITTVGVSGPLHHNLTPSFWLGSQISAEADPESGSDADGINNLLPLAGTNDMDAADDALPINMFTDRFTHCVAEPITITLSLTGTLSGPGTTVYLNLWADWDRSGAWGGVITYAGCQSGLPDEWAVQNYAVTLNGNGLHTVVLPPVLPANAAADKDMWLRLTASNIPASAADGSGPLGGYALGETEDYLLRGLTIPAAPPVVPPITIDDFTAVDLGNNILYLPLVGAPTGPIIAPPAGAPNEVEVAYIGGDSNFVDKPVVVTALGSGGSFKLQSWQVLFQAQPPTFLKETPNQLGGAVRLVALFPDNFTGTTYHLLVSGAVRADGNLWLTTWRVDEDGTFNMLDQRGFGSNVGVSIQRFALAYRPVNSGPSLNHYQLATPVLTTDGNLRLVTWAVNPNTGAVNGSFSSSDWATPHAQTPLQAVYLPGDAISGHQVVVSYRDASNRMQFNQFIVGDNGSATSIGSGNNGSGRTMVSIRGNNNVTLTNQDMALARLNRSGLVFTTANSNGVLSNVYSISNQGVNCPGFNCRYLPHEISNTSRDLDANAGVTIPAPVPATLQGRLADLSVPGGDVIFDWPASGFSNHIIASVTKVMTLIVAIDAIEDGDVNLNDPVVISQFAASAGGSRMNLNTGDVYTLEDLLYGLMLPSGNDAGRAIAEHIAGNVNTFTVMMNNKAGALNLANTLYCDSFAGCLSNPADQVLLWEAAHENPLFQKFAGEDNYTACGVDINNNPICIPMTRPVGTVYPGVISWKNGVTGTNCGGNGLGFCSNGGCLSIEAVRLERPLMVNTSHPANNGSPNPFNDALNLYDYGYRLLFTPDFMGSGPASPTFTGKDLAVDAINDNVSLTAVLNNSNQLQFCSWTPDPIAENIQLLGCSTRTVSGLHPSVTRSPASLVGLARFYTFGFDGGYFLAHLENGVLRTRFYHLGARP